MKTRGAFGQGLLYFATPVEEVAGAVDAGTSVKRTNEAKSVRLEESPEAGYGASKHEVPKHLMRMNPVLEAESALVKVLGMMTSPTCRTRLPAAMVETVVLLVMVKSADPHHFLMSSENLVARCTHWAHLLMTVEMGVALEAQMM